jgi:hypothetical protein
MLDLLLQRTVYGKLEMITNTHRTKPHSQTASQTFTLPGMPPKPSNQVDRKMGE